MMIKAIFLPFLVLLLLGFGFVLTLGSRVGSNIVLHPDILEEERKNEFEGNSLESMSQDPKTNSSPVFPIVINTWGFQEANVRAWEILQDGGSSLDAVEAGATTCEEMRCDRTVGYGGSPDENGETTLDAMIMDGETHAVGAVGCLRRVKNAVGVARKVMEHTTHTLLVGELATQFALQMGFPEEDLSTEESREMHDTWRENNCQPNFWRNVRPNPSRFCGPYAPSSIGMPSNNNPRIIDQYNHDTIGIVAIDSKGRIASATSSNGARNKIPGRVGDAPIVGAGGYVDKEVGGAAATGDGDIMVRFLPSLIAVEKMRSGMHPQIAAQEALSRIVKVYPKFSGALVAVNLQGEYGAACHNIGAFPYCVTSPSRNGTVVDTVKCTSTTSL